MNYTLAITLTYTHNGRIKSKAPVHYESFKAKSTESISKKLKFLLHLQKIEHETLFYIEILQYHRAKLIFA